MLINMVAYLYLNQSNLQCISYMQPIFGTKFGTEVDRYIINIFRCGAIGQLSPGGHGGYFPKWPQADIRKTKQVR